MNSSKERRRLVYRSLYKKYLTYMRKITEQKRRNLILKNSNSELWKVVVKLREDVRKSSLKNSSLKAEIYDLSLDRHSMMMKNRRLYETLTSIKKDTLTISTRLDSLLEEKFADIKSDRPSSFTPPVVNGQVLKNPKETVPNTVKYPRYNFRDCIYVQDLSPIMEENAEVKSTKMPDITRRLGQRAKVHQPCLSPSKSDDSGTMNCEEIDVINPPWTSDEMVSQKSANVTDDDISYIEPEESVNRSMHRAMDRSIPSLVNDELRRIPKNETLEPHMDHYSATFSSGKENTLNIRESSVVTINLLPQSDVENTSHGDNDFHPSIFVNVFPRRKKQNDFGHSILHKEAIEEYGNGDSTQEPNSTYIEKEDSLKKRSTTPSQNSLDQTCGEMIVNDSSVGYLHTEKDDSGCSTTPSKNSVDQGIGETESSSMSIKNFTVCLGEQEKSNSRISVSIPSSISSVIGDSLVESQEYMELTSLGKNISKDKPMMPLKSSLDEQKTDISLFNLNRSEDGGEEEVKVPSRLSNSKGDGSYRSGYSTTVELSEGDLVSNDEKKSPGKRSFVGSSTECSPKKSSASEEVKEDENSFSKKNSDKLSRLSPKNKSSHRKASLRSSREKKSEVSSKTAEKVLPHSSNDENIEENSPKYLTGLHKTLRSKKPISFVESPIENRNNKRQRGRKKK